MSVLVPHKLVTLDEPPELRDEVGCVGAVLLNREGEPLFQSLKPGREEAL